MWDNPRLLNAAAGFLVGLSLLVFAILGARLALRSPLFALRTVDVVTPLKQAPRDAIERAVRAHISGNFFGARLEEIRAAVEQVPWVRRVQVRRVWPDRLEIAIEEHVALARWGASGLVNTHGERFAGSGDAALPLFIGPEGSEAEMTSRYRRYSRIVEPLGSTLERVVLTPRYAWQLRLANGLNVMLGRDGDLAERRLQRFIDVYEQTLARMPGPRDYVDLRYANGFAFRMKG